MPSAHQASPPAHPLSPQAVPAEPSAGTASQLAQASAALWTATLSLMTAFMHTPAPAHRWLLARRISRNFETLAGQECFDEDCRGRFTRLSRRWEANALHYAPDHQEEPSGVRGLLRFLF